MKLIIIAIQENQCAEHVGANIVKYFEDEFVRISDISDVAIRAIQQFEILVPIMTPKSAEPKDPPAQILQQRQINYAIDALNVLFRTAQHYEDRAKNEENTDECLVATMLYVQALYKLYLRGIYWNYFGLATYYKKQRDVCNNLIFPMEILEIGDENQCRFDYEWKNILERSTSLKLPREQWLIDDCLRPYRKPTTDA